VNHLRLVNSETGEVHDVDSHTADLEDKIAGLKVTVDKQAREIGRLTRKLEQDDPQAHHPQRREIHDLIEYWKEATGHTKSKASKDRFDLIRARLKDGFDLDTIRLAIDGIARFPYVVNAQRRTEGKTSQRFDQLSHALGSGEKVERFANLGHQARRQG
jgi:uncharacterized phage protein (TIGR02220 family)